MSTVIFITANTTCDALGGWGRAQRAMFEKQGFGFVEVNFAQEGALQLLQQTISTQPIELVFTSCGMLADMNVDLNGVATNLWKATGIPYISLYGDTPAYFFDRHIHEGPGVASIYGYVEHYELRKSLPQINGLLGVLPVHSTPLLEKDEIDFSVKERGRIVFLKNGNDPRALMDNWNKVMPDRAAAWLVDLAKYLEAKVATDIGDDINAVVLDYFQAKKLDPERATELRLLFIAQLDDYLRRVKSTMMAEVLLDYPVDIYGFHWEHVDFSKGRAKHMTGLDYADSDRVVRDSLAMLDMSPNVGTQPHERVSRAFDMYTTCLTNEQPFLKQHFSRWEEFSYRFDPDNLRGLIERVLGNPKHYVELGIDVGTQFRRDFPSDGFVNFMLDTAALLRISAGSSLPNCQNYFVWPPRKLKY